MALVKVLDKINWEEVQNTVYQVLKERKHSFNREIISKIITDRLVKQEMDIEVLECSYFQLLLLNTLENLVNAELLYEYGGWYFPTDYMILQEYDTKNTQLLYYCGNNDKNTGIDKHHFIEVESLQEPEMINPRDFLLIGGFDDKEGNKIKKPEIELEEISLLYQALLIEGIRKDEIINHILNYYQVNKVHSQDNYFNLMTIKPKKNPNKVRSLKPNTGR